MYVETDHSRYRSVAHLTKRFLTLCSLLNWFHHPLVLEGGFFCFCFRSIFSRLCRVRNFPHPLFISQSQGDLQKVWVKLSFMFVEQFSSPWCMRVKKMHKCAEFHTFWRVRNLFVKRASGKILYWLQHH